MVATDNLKVAVEEKVAALDIPQFDFLSLILPLLIDLLGNMLGDCLNNDDTVEVAEKLIKRKSLTARMLTHRAFRTACRSCKRKVSMVDQSRIVDAMLSAMAESDIKAILEDTQEAVDRGHIDAWS